jgi:RHS repeat-associated protein
MVYGYDALNRLTKAEDLQVVAFSEMFGYDMMGRMLWQRRGANAQNATGGEYRYNAGTSQAAWVEPGMGETEREMGGNASSPNFVYDADGNLIFDRSKGEMNIVYDILGRPVSFERTEEDGTTVRVESRYHAGGARAGKFVISRAASATMWDTLSATHYGLGYEVRETQEGNSKVITSLPQGLGRYAANGEKEWYVKNRLGSTMLVYGGGKVAAAYDYRSFGKRVAVVVPTDKVTEEFTGKELDEETDLGYWGARYLDADLGLWVSVDPARQFMNPYAYAGNGFSPVNAVDEDGNVIFIPPVLVIQAMFWGGVGAMAVTRVAQTAVVSYRVYQPLITKISSISLFGLGYNSESLPKVVDQALGLDIEPTTGMLSVSPFGLGKAFRTITDEIMITQDTEQFYTDFTSEMQYPVSDNTSVAPIQEPASDNVMLPKHTLEIRAPSSDSYVR